MMPLGIQVYKSQMLPQLGDEWDLAKGSLKFESRYFNNDIKNVLDVLCNGIEKCLNYDATSIVVEVYRGNPDFKIFRARCFDSEEDAEKAKGNVEKMLAPPPARISRSGRMNVAGIPVFYGATTRRLALAETRPPVGCHVVVAQFEVIESFRLLDIERLNSLSEDLVNSVFEDDESTYLADLINKFCKEITRTVSPKEASLEYIITQAISEYFSSISNINVHGLLYDSCQAIRETRKYEKNIMLFNKFSVIDGVSDGYPSKLSFHERPAVRYAVTGAGFSTDPDVNDGDSRV